MAKNIQNDHYQSIHLMSQATLQPHADQATEHNLLVCHLVHLKTKSDLTQEKTFPRYVHTVPNASICICCDQISMN